MPKIVAKMARKAEQKADLTVKKKRKYDREKAARTRARNRELARQGLPKLHERRSKRPYTYTGAHIGKDGKAPRKFKGALGENMKSWQSQSQYAHLIEDQKKSVKKNK